MNQYVKPSLILLLLLLASFSSSTSCSAQGVSGVDELLASLRQNHVPDGRIQLWDVQVHQQPGSIQVKGNLSSQKTYAAVEQALKKQYPQVDNQLVLLPENEHGSLVNALVNNSVIHLRREPSSATELVTQALLGTPVRILKTASGKSLIQVPDGYIGWVNTAEVQRVNEEQLAAYKQAAKVIYTAQYGMSYSDPNVDSMPVTDLVIGNIARKVAEEAGFTQIQYPDGRRGWVRSRELLPVEDIFYKSTTPQKLVQTALRFHGIPYLWGGASSKNLDCSGLVCNVYFMNGIQLPRDSNMQALIGREVTTDFVPDKLEPGDLLFFGRKASGEQKERVSHVAMYIGNGEYIHAAGHRERVSINSMDRSKANFIASYPGSFVRAIRILGAEQQGFRPIPENAFYNEIIGNSP